MTAPARARRLGPSRIELTIHEGRNRQVKRMCDAVGHPVQRLHRAAYAGLTLEGGEGRPTGGVGAARGGVSNAAHIVVGGDDVRAAAG